MLISLLRYKHVYEGGHTMPVGNPNAQTKATEKYARKVGLISKSYKLKREVVDEFAKACEKAGVSQAAKLTQMMIAFIEENKELEA